MNAIFPEAKFIGYEILKDRKNEANRIYEKLELQNCSVELQDVLADDFDLPNADIYFIYDFSEMVDVDKILKQIATRMNDQEFFLITRGERVDSLIKSKYRNFWLENGMIKIGNLKIYSSKINLEFL